MTFTLVTVAAWTAASFIGGVMVDAPLSGDLARAGGSPSPVSRVFRALVSGTTAGLFSAFLELRVLPGFSRRVGFGWLLASRTIVYAAVSIFAVLVTVQFIAAAEVGISLREVLASDGFHDFLTDGRLARLITVLVFASFLINALHQVARLLGPRTAAQILLGRYLRPIHEDRSFLFVDLAGSTEIAERLGPLKFAEFKNDFFHDIAEPVIESRGQIVQYVGDEVLITWPRRRKGRSVSEDCVRCFFDLRRKVQSREQAYRARYGIVPHFSAGLHSGPVVTSQMGDIKREIAFSGDTVNTASRIQGLCRTLGRDFLASVEVLTDSSMPIGVEVEHLGDQNLRGKALPVRLVALSCSNADHHVD